MRSKLLNVQIEDRVTVTVITWRSPGSVTWTNRFHDEAPSMVAASYRSAGMALSPARNVTVKNGTAFHTLTRITDGMASDGSDSQPAGQLSTRWALASSGPMPESVSSALTLPKIGSRSERQLNAVTTVGTTHGTRSSPASTARPRRRWCNSRAADSPSTTLNTSAYAVKTNEFTTPVWNCSSPARAM